MELAAPYKPYGTSSSESSGQKLASCEYALRHVGQIMPCENGPEGGPSISSAPSLTQNWFPGGYSVRQTGQLLTAMGTFSVTSSGVGGGGRVVMPSTARVGIGPGAFRRQRTSSHKLPSSAPAPKRATNPETIYELCTTRPAEPTKKPGQQWRSILVAIRGSELLHLFGECGHRIKQIGDEEVVRHLRDRGLFVFVDRNDRFAALHTGQVLDRS